MELKVTDTFGEIDILVDGRKVGYAEIKPNKKELARLEIWEPYQGINYGKQAVDILISTYRINNLQPLQKYLQSQMDEINLY